MDRGNFDFIPETCLCKSKENLEVLEQVITLAVEIAREGREGKKVGTIFTVFDAGNVMARSRCMILDPLAYHDKNKKQITDSNLRETIKELAQLDGAFVVDDDGVMLSACRYLDVTVENIELPLGLGSRHMAAASISQKVDCVAIAVSESSIVRIFIGGRIVSEIIPEIWLLKRYSTHLEGPYLKRNLDEMTVLDKENV
ncbi:MAG: diadenylate cyclase [Desulfobulbaceae bacterium]|nr:diadenylate cyclase [Desulfobulbaceae bacterium]